MAALGTSGSAGRCRSAFAPAGCASEAKRLPDFFSAEQRYPTGGRCSAVCLCSVDLVEESKCRAVLGTAFAGGRGERGGVGRAVQASVSRHTRLQVAQTERSGVQRLCGVGWDGLAMSKGGRLLLLMERFLDGDEIWISIAFSGIFLYYVLNMLTPLPVRTARSGWAFCFYVGTLLFYAGTVYKTTFKP